MHTSSKLVSLLFIAVSVACDDGSDPDTEASDAAVVIKDAAGNEDTGAESDADTPEPDAGPSATFSAVYEILSGRCLGCHGATSPRGGLDLSTQSVAYGELTTPGDAQGGMCANGTRKRVVANEPEQSLLLQKLKHTQDCGGPMPAAPQGGSTPDPLTEEQLSVISDWISAGALDD